MNKKAPSKPQLWSTMSLASTMGMHMVAGVLVGGLMGYGLDYVFGTAHWFTAIFLILGIAAGFMNVWRDTKRLLRETKDITP